MIEDKVIKFLKQVKPLGDKPIELKPASEEDIKRFEGAHEFELPTEVKTWLRRCNGADTNPGGLVSLFSTHETVSLDWYFKEYPEWKSKGWIPLANDGCGDIYILLSKQIAPVSGTHPVCFLDQADFNSPAYFVASGLWRFLYFLLENEILNERGIPTYWPFNKASVLKLDPNLAECRDFPLPWEVE